MKTLNIAEKDILQNLNLITFLRRIRQHGMALNFLLTQSQRQIASKMSLTRPVEYIESTGNDIWFQNESFSMKDKLQLSFYKKFMNIQGRK